MTLSGRTMYMRKKLGMSQKQLAEASGITQATISRIESGQTKQLKSEALKRLAKALKVTMDYLVGNADEIAPSDIARLDSTARHILAVYQKLSASGRKQLADFVRFLDTHA